MFKNALISVSDKTGLLDFVKPLHKKGMRIVSTGGTAQYLKDNQIQVVDVSEQTGFPEVMGGRVKTLHPNVHMPILSRQNHPEDFELLKSKGLEPFDLVICNLYPFENAVLANVSGEDLIEKIDIGGPTVLRASAKNFSQVTVVCDPSDYSWILEKEKLELADRKKLAAKVFAHCSSYDSLVARELGAGWGTEFSLGGHKVMDLRYGENPQQSASWYRLMADSSGLHSAEIIQGKALSYNNILDLDAASGLVQSLVQSFLDQAIVVAVKHNNPCGVGISKNSSEAMNKALKADPISVFGGIIACNRTVERTEAEVLSQLFLECIVAPDFSKEALQIFAAKKNLRILKWPYISKASAGFEAKTVNGGLLLQSKDQFPADVAHWVMHGGQPSSEILQDLIFAEKVCASLKSNAIALVKDGQTVGLGMGQVNRVDAVKHAIERMRTHFGLLENVVMASDAFFPFADSVQVAAEAGVKWIIQPGGSLKDAEVLTAAKDLNIKMVISGNRHFKH